MSDWTFVDAYASSWGSESTDGAGEVVTCQVREAGEDDGTDGEVELWGSGCVVFRPAPPDDVGKCQLLTVQIGAQRYAVGAHDSRAAQATGALNPGDAAFCSPTGKVAFRANANGSASMIKQGKDADALVSIEDDDTILASSRFGQIELGENGVQMMLPTGESFIMKAGKIQFTAPQVVINGAVVALGIGASIPLGAVPATSLPPGAPCFGIQHPIPTILVPP